MRIGLDGFHFHDIRRTCATFLLLQRVQDRVVTEILSAALHRTDAMIRPGRSI
jgi:hypothetical protein